MQIHILRNVRYFYLTFFVVICICYVSLDSSEYFILATIINSKYNRLATFRKMKLLGHLLEIVQEVLRYSQRIAYSFEVDMMLSKKCMEFFSTSTIHLKKISTFFIGSFLEVVGTHTSPCKYLNRCSRKDMLYQCDCYLYRLQISFKNTQTLLFGSCTIAIGYDSKMKRIVHNMRYDKSDRHYTEIPQQYKYNETHQILRYDILILSHTKSQILLCYLVNKYILLTSTLFSMISSTFTFHHCHDAASCISS